MQVAEEFDSGVPTCSNRAAISQFRVWLITNPSPALLVPRDFLLRILSVSLVLIVDEASWLFTHVLRLCIEVPSVALRTVRVDACSFELGL